MSKLTKDEENTANIIGIAWVISIVLLVFAPPFGVVGVFISTGLMFGSGLK